MLVSGVSCVQFPAAGWRLSLTLRVIKSCGSRSRFDPKTEDHFWGHFMAPVLAGQIRNLLLVPVLWFVFWGRFLAPEMVFRTRGKR